MRVISGKYRGKKIASITGLTTRPMADRVKEDLFNILDNYFIYENKVGFDIFAGSGQLGLEGLSRGLKFCYFNDLSPESNSQIKENLSFLLPGSDYELWQADFLQSLMIMETQEIKIDILFLDPPFKELSYYDKIVEIMLTKNILNNYGIIATEANVSLDFSNHKIKLLKHKTYSNKHLYILRKED